MSGQRFIRGGNKRGWGPTLAELDLAVVEDSSEAEDPEIEALSDNDQKGLPEGDGEDNSSDE